MSKVYSKPCKIYKMMGHIENPCIVRTVHSGISRLTHGNSVIFSHDQAYSGTLRCTEKYLGVIETY